MATPSSRANLKEYALRALGKPVIEINVDDDQLEDRLDEALQYYAQYHYDGIRRTYLKYKLTAADKTRLSAINPVEESATDSFIAGDDDQGIYKWNGAHVNTFINLEGTREILEQSHRVPRKPFELANKIINKVK